MRLFRIVIALKCDCLIDELIITSTAVLGRFIKQSFSLSPYFFSAIDCFSANHCWQRFIIRRRKATPIIHQSKTMNHVVFFFFYTANHILSRESKNGTWEHDGYIHTHIHAHSHVCRIWIHCMFQMLLLDWQDGQKAEIERFCVINDITTLPYRRARKNSKCEETTMFPFNNEWIA